MNTDPARVGDYVSRCPDCGKTCFVTRKAAKTTARRLYPGTQLSAYRCGDYWHYGHLPKVIRYGVLPRDTIVRPDHAPGTPTC